MTVKLKTFIAGLSLCAVAAFLLGMNYGRGAPLLSNPFHARQITEPVKEKAEALVDGAREKLHQATKPDTKK
jgi:hypothetical protein